MRHNLSCLTQSEKDKLTSALKRLNADLPFDVTISLLKAALSKPLSVREHVPSPGGSRYKQHYLSRNTNTLRSKLLNSNLLSTREIGQLRKILSKI